MLNADVFYIPYFLLDVFHINFVVFMLTLDPMGSHTAISPASTVKHFSARHDTTDPALLVDKLKSIARQVMRDRTQLWTKTGSVVVQVDQRHSEEFHVFRHAEDLCRRQLDEIELLQLFRSCAVDGEIRIEEGFVVGPPPLCETVADVPVEILLGWVERSQA